MTTRRMGGVAVAAVRAAAVAAVVVVAGAAAAHAYLERATPPPGGVVPDALEKLELEFTTPVEVLFSTFDLLRLEVEAAAAPADPTAPTERELQRLHALGGVLARQASEGDEAAADLRPALVVEPARGTTRTVRLVLAEPLPPGVYVVAWEVLAADGHVTRDHHVILVVGSAR